MEHESTWMSWNQYMDRLLTREELGDPEISSDTKSTSTVTSSFALSEFEPDPSAEMQPWTPELTEAALLAGEDCPTNSPRLSLDDVDLNAVTWAEEPSVTMPWSDTDFSFELPIEPIESFVDDLLNATISTANKVVAPQNKSNHHATKRVAKECKAQHCTNRVRSRGLCKTHGGGKRCIAPGCTTCSVGGVYCIRHGGGKKCGVRECQNVVQSRGMCKAHGGGARCTVIGCNKSSQGRGLCTSHGGGRRCSVPGCGKGAQSKGKCYSHGRISL